MEPEEFYRLRDNRTNACVPHQLYTRSGVAVSIDDAAAQTYSSQVAFVLAVNLTSRWCRRVRAAGTCVPVDRGLHALLPSAPNDLAGFSVAVAKASDPFGDFDSGQPPGGEWLRLHIGRGVAPPGAYRIQGDGWLATAGDAVLATKSSRSRNPLGAALAACVGVAWAFRAALGEQTLPESVRLSLWNLRGGEEAAMGPENAGGDLGLVVLVGCGAVGSSLAHLLPLLSLRARVVLVDRDSVDFTNLNRSPLFLFADVGLKKCDVTAAYLRRAGLDAEPIPMWFDEAVSGGLLFRERPDVVVPAANERGVRHLIQHQVPPLQVYGTTGRDWQAFLGRHIPAGEDCLACRFPAQVPSEPPLACATGRASSLVGAADSRDAALPFLSLAAGVLGAAELLKVTTDAFPVNPNFACLDFRGPLADFMGSQRDAAATCICRSQTDVWTRLNGGTRFADLVRRGDRLGAPGVLGR